ncbi:MAG: lamin tail domain-containing protein [Planctomycetota bacterium]|jgi:hypothetical protein
MKISLLLGLALSFLVGSVWARPLGDLDENCTVNLRDLRIFVGQWLNDAACSEPNCADLDDDNKVNMTDLALLAEKWRWTDAPLVISEFMASNRTTMLDGDGRASDWIEIHNPNDANISLNGWYLTDDDRDLTKWRFPDGLTLASGGYLVVFASGQDDANYPYLDPNGYYHTNFKLGKGGDYLALVAADAATISHEYESYEYDDGEFGFPYQKADYSYGIVGADPNQEAYFDAPATPGAGNGATVLGLVADTKFNYDRGFYQTAFSLEITTDTTDANIYYTTNGSEPTPTTGTLYAGPVGISATGCVRAAGFKTGWLPTNADTQTYIFPNDVSLQPGMDPNIVNDPCYSGIITGALTSLPTMSIVMDENDLANLQAQSTYPPGSPPKEELPASVELLYPDDRDGFHIDCAIEGHSWSIAKRAFRLKFKRDFGPGKLKFPFFESDPLNADSAVDFFDRLVLRGGKNMSWALGGTHGGGGNVTYARDQWTRDTQIAMSGTASHGIFAHLYINGRYWGLYNPCERPDEQFTSAYFGAEPEDWLASNHGLERGDGHLSGNSARYDQMMALADGKDFEDASKYKEFKQLLDIPKYLDYVILYWYAGIGDGIDNNWYGGNCNIPPGSYMFFMWDSELIFINYVSDSPGSEVAWVNTLFKDPSSDPGFDSTTIIRLWKSARENDDFMMTFADRVYKHCFHGGALDETVTRARWQVITDLIEDAVVCESARWGDEVTNPARTREDDWRPAIQIVDNRMQGNVATFIAALRTEDLYPSIDPPIFRVNDADQHGGYISTSDNLSMVNPNGTGTIYYTLDGTDLRPVETSLVTENAPKKVLVPAGDIGTSWRTDPNFDDSTWTHGTPITPGKTGGVGYEIQSGYEDYITYDVQTQMYTYNDTCYIRIPFTADPAAFDLLTLRVRYDDGFVAYINGVEVWRENAPASPQWNSSATTGHSDAAAVIFQEFDISDHITDMAQGDNILAVHGLNNSGGNNNKDFLISAELVADANVAPGAIEYAGAFTLDKSTLVRARVLDGNEWSALNEAAFAIGPVAENLRITEIMYHPKQTGEPNDANAEFIELKNIGASTLNLNLVSFTEGIHFTFGAVELTADDYVLVVKDQNAFADKYGTDPNIQVAGQYTRRLDNAGERIRLQDAVSGTILDFEYEDGWRPITDGVGFSLTIIEANNPDPNSWGEKQSWRASAYVDGSPGWDDTGAVPNPGSVVINEVMSHSHGSAPDWIELYNSTDETINIGGWFLSDSDTNVTKYEIADGTTIDANGHIVFYEDVNFGQSSGDPGSLIPFALSETGEEVCLSSAQSGVLTGYQEVEDFGASETGVPFGRYYKSSTGNFNFVAMEANTPGAPNSYPKVGPIVINEIMYNPQSGNQNEEYVELYNITAADVNLFDDQANPWKFTDGITFTFPADSNIPAYGLMLVAKDPATFTSTYGTMPAGVQVLGPYGGRLSNGGEKVEIGKFGDLDQYGSPCYIRIDRVNYSDGSHPENCPGGVDLWPTEPDGNGPSLTRIDPNLYGNDPTNWQAAASSPGQ